MQKPSVTIIGLGKAGKAFLRILTENGYRIHSVFSRNPVSLTLKGQYPHSLFKKGLPTAVQTGDLIIIAVSDDAIAEVTEQLSAQDSDWSGKKIVHLSGAMPADVLHPMKEKGATVASFHPMKSLTAQTADFKGCYFDMDGDENLIALLQEIALNLEAKVIRVKPEEKAFLHASAVTASNYLVVLSDYMAKIAAKAGLSEKDAVAAFTPLMYSTIQNINELGITDALTGPVVRGDVQTVKQHLQSLQKYPELASFYKKMAVDALQIALQRNEHLEAYEKIREILSKPVDKP